MIMTPPPISVFHGQTNSLNYLWHENINICKCWWKKSPNDDTFQYDQVKNDENMVKKCWWITYFYYLMKKNSKKKK